MGALDGARTQFYVLLTDIIVHCNLMCDHNGGFGMS